jgi:hypothetical protein
LAQVFVISNPYSQLALLFRVRKGVYQFFTDINDLKSGRIYHLFLDEQENK